VVNGHPTVSHNYLRDHRYNLWFTLAVPREMGLEATLRILERERVGRCLASAPEVSHCYARNPIQGFPYTLYSVVHAPDPESGHQTAARLAQEAGVDDYAVLFSLKEFKKVRLRYFLPELDRWWALHKRA
jgi:hypothetical protein